MSNLLVIFGITGQQGGSLADVVLNDVVLSKRFKIRGVCRDTLKPAAQTLQSRGVEIMKVDLDDRSSIHAALQGAHTVYAMTASIYKPGGFEQETLQGKAVADEAVIAGVKLLIWSTVPSPRKISGGKYPVESFDNKDEVKDYILGLSIKSAFFAPGTFMQNFQEGMSPRPGPDGSLAITNFISPSTSLALVDINDTGKYVATILADPDKYAGTTLCCATRTYTMTEIVDTMSRVTGKKIGYNQVTQEVFASFLPEHLRLTLVNMFAYFEEFGYFGANTIDEVKWAASIARQKPTELEEYLKNEPLKI